MSLDPTPYEVLGVRATASHVELRRAYRRMLRETHPDTGGSAERFVAVQRAWELVGTVEARVVYDRRASERTPETDDDEGVVWSASAAGRASTTERTARARSYGHPGGQARERFIALLREWVGRGVELGDPYDPELLRRAPDEIRGLLAKALAEEATARIASRLGATFAVWSDVAVPRDPADKIDHVVLGPSGLFVVHSAAWREPVRLSRGELVGVPGGARPVRDLTRQAKALAYALGVRVSAVVVVAPDEALAEPVATARRRWRPSVVLVRRSALAAVIAEGVPGEPVALSREDVDEMFEVRDILQRGVRFV